VEFGDEVKEEKIPNLYGLWYDVFNIYMYTEKCKYIYFNVYISYIQDGLKINKFANMMFFDTWIHRWHVVVVFLLCM
jgi:hypothetical protein